MQYAPRRVPVALRAKAKKAPDDLVKQEAITPVTSPTAWIRSMVTVPKKNGKLRTCLDPRDLNRADESSYLTTFHTSFGRYRWRRLPFGISSAPEVFQQRMHHLIEGFSGIEVLTDDLIVISCGNNVEEANSDHDRAFVNFLERCKEQARC